MAALVIDYMVPQFVMVNNSHCTRLVARSMQATRACGPSILTTLQTRALAMAAHPSPTKTEATSKTTGEPRITYAMAVREFKHEFVRQRVLDMPRMVAEWRERRKREAQQRKSALPY